MQKIRQLVICFLLITISLSSMLTVSARSFKDVKSSAWYKSAVDYVCDQNYMKGVGGNQFEPETKVSRAMLATVLYRMSGSTAKYTASSFTDNKRGEWYFDGIEYCYRSGIVVGYGNGRFGVNDTLLREDMMTMFYRYAVDMKLTTGKTGENPLATYTDKNKVSSYAKTPINWCLINGVVDGVSYTKISPDTTATRAQLAQVLMNFDERVLGVDVTKYRKSSSNVYGLAAQNVRLNQKILSFRIGGLPASGDFRVKVQYKVGGKIYYEDVTDIENHKHFVYRGDADCLFASADVNMGRTMSATATIIVLENNRSIFKKTVYFGEYFQNASDNTPLYYKGKMKMDSRILLYHEFTKNAPANAQYSVVSTPERFEENIRYILDRGYTIIPLEALIEYQNGTRALPQKSVILTFDDGYLSNYTMIYPILKKYNIPATIFVTVSTMDGAGKMTWAQMKEMESSGLVNIQSHSWKHEDHAAMPEGRIHNYIYNSFDLLEEKLGKRSPRLFAYPHGRYNDQTVKIVASYDVPLQVTTNWNALDMDRLDLARLPRINVSYDADMATLLKVAK